MKKILSIYSAFAVVTLFLWFEVDAGGMVIRPFDGFLFLAAASAFAVVAVQKGIQRTHIQSFEYAFVILTTYVVTNGLVLSGTRVAVREALQGAEFILLMFLIGELTRRQDRRKIFVHTLTVGFALLAVATVMWHVANGYMVNYKHLDEPKLVFGLFAYFTVARFIVERGKTGRRAVVAFIAVGLMLLSGERKGWVAFAVGITFVYFVARQKNPFSLILRGRISVKGGVLLSVIAGGVLLVGMQSAYVMAQLQALLDAWSSLTAGGVRFERAGSASDRVRLFLFHFSVETVQAHPIWGVGVGEFKEVIQFVAPNKNFVRGAHNEYQRYAVETGLVGLGLYVLTWTLMLRSAWHAVRHTKLFQSEATIAAGLVAYGAVVNVFLGGGALNTIFLVLPAGLLQGITNDPERQAIRRKTRTASLVSNERQGGVNR